jgi:hypothetical protein
MNVSAAIQLETLNMKPGTQDRRMERMKRPAEAVKDTLIVIDAQDMHIHVARFLSWWLPA